MASRWRLGRWDAGWNQSNWLGGRRLDLPSEFMFYVPGLYDRFLLIGENPDGSHTYVSSFVGSAPPPAMWVNLAAFVGPD